MTLHRISVASAIGLLLSILAVIAVGEALSYPARRSVGIPPPGLHAQSVTLPMASDGASISGWWVPGTPGAGAVLLLHGVRADRRQMLERAEFLHTAGYAVLLVDLPSHGESTGERITFGLREAEGVRTALGYMAQQLPHEKIAVIGVSLGAAALMLAKVDPAPSAVVLESMYPTITEAVQDRLGHYLGPLGRSLAPLLLWQLPLRTGIRPEQLQPIAEMPSLHVPVLIASGANDLHTTVAETRRIFEAANKPKQLWVVDGAAHVDLHAYTPHAYETVVLGFLRPYLRSGT